MSNILEKAWVALINNETDKANQLFHDFVLTRSRQIHESLRSGEDLVLDENWEQSLAIDEMFTEADLEDTFDDTDVDVTADGSTDTTDVTVTDTDSDTTEITSSDTEDEDEDEDLEDDSDVTSIETRVDDLEAQLQALSVEFDALMGGEPDVTDVTVDAEVKEGDLEITQKNDGDLTIHHDVNHDEYVDVDFAKLGESALDELEPVNVKHVEGKFTSTDRATVNTKSPVPNVKVDKRLAGEPVVIKSDDYNGFDRQPAPKSDTNKLGKNLRTKAVDGRSKVSKDGDKSALLNHGGEDKAAQTSLFTKKV